MNSRVYYIDFDRLVLLLLPVCLRRPVMFALLKSLIAPVEYLYGVFMTFQKHCNYDLAHNSQVCYMEAALNDVFDGVTRRIRIEDQPAARESVYVYIEAEQQVLYIYAEGESLPSNEEQVYVPQSWESTVRYDFVVLLNGLVLTAGERSRMKAMINYYRIAFKRFLIG